MNETVKDRTVQFIKYKGINMKTFETKCNLSTGYVTSMRKGYGSNKLKNVLTAYPELNREWLLYGEGNMLKDTTFSSCSDCKKEFFTDEHTVLPLLPMSAQGGKLNDFVTSITSRDCEKIMSPIKGADFAISVSGNSMAPEYPEGCQILIKRINERAFIEWGRTYVLDTCNGTVVKTLVPSEHEGCVKCVSINQAPEYAPFEVCLRDVYGIYRVLLCMSRK